MSETTDLPPCCANEPGLIGACPCSCHPTETERAVAALDAIGGGDGEHAHAQADQILLGLVPAEVRDAHERLVERAAWWAYS